MSISRSLLMISGLWCLFAVTCAEEEPPSRLVPLVTMPAAKAFTSDLGYSVTITEARLCVRDFTFAIGGESHSVASRLDTLRRLLVGTAHAHPGHNGDGGVAGELAGKFLVNFSLSEKKVIGVASMLEGEYASGSFTFATCDDVLGVEAADPAFGHTMYIAGTAEKDGTTTSFAMMIDAPDDRVLADAPFAQVVGPESPVDFRLQFEPVDPFENDTFVDGIDFAVLDQDNDNSVTIAADVAEAATITAYNQIRRALLSHDHYQFVAN